MTLDTWVQLNALTILAILMFPVILPVLVKIADEAVENSPAIRGARAAVAEMGEHPNWSPEDPRWEAWRRGERPQAYWDIIHGTERERYDA